MLKLLENHVKIHLWEHFSFHIFELGNIFEILNKKWHKSDFKQKIMFLVNFFNCLI